MKIDTDIRDQAYVFFIQEAPELLQLIESELLTLSAERTPAKVHNMMRAAHSIKGGAASVGLETLKTIAHSLEDVFKALFNEEVKIDTELESLLLQAYDCLRLPLMEQISTGQFNIEQAMAAAEPVFSQLEEILGDLIGSNQLPTSVELGVDIASSIFEIDVAQGIERLQEVLAHPEQNQVAGELRAQAEVFTGIAELLSLPGFAEISQTAIAALDAHPERVTAVAQAAIANFQAARQAVLDGDREQGGIVSPQLWQLAQAEITQAGSPASQADNIASQPLTNLFTETEFTETDSDNATINLEDIFTPIEEMEELDLEGVFDFVEPEADLILPPDEITQLETTEREALSSNSPSLDDIFGDWGEEAAPEVSTEAGQLTPVARGSNIFNLTPSQAPGASSLDIPAAIKSVETSFEEFPSLVESSALVQKPATPSPTSISQTNAKLVSQEIKLEATTVQPPPASLFVKVDLERIDRLNNIVGELAINRNSLYLQNEQLQATLGELNRRFQKFRAMTNRLRDLSDQMLVSPERYRLEQQSSALQNFAPKPGQGDSSSSLLANFDSLEMDTYSELHNLLQDTLEDMVQLEEVVEDVTLISGQSSETIEGQRRMMSNLRDDLMWARMIPIGEVLNRFPRLMRDLSNSYQKPVDLKLTGTGVLVDKAAIEKLNYPLMHLLRNAFDHGIEPPEVRQQQNKPERGTIEIRTFHRGNNTIIEIRDDGKGIDFERLKTKAVELEWLTPEQAAVASTNQLLEFLFQPGFSTAPQVSELSGRGVGLDVVRSELRSIKGSVSVSSELGKGTTFTLKLPLTLNIAKLLVCSVGTVAYAIPSDSIEEIVIPQPENIKRSGHQRFLHWRGRIVPAYHASELMNYNCVLPEALPSQSLARSVPTPEEWASPMLTIGIDRHLIAIEVDRLMSEQELVIKPLGSTLSAPSYIYGCSIMGDGSLVPVLDVSNLMLQVLDGTQGAPIAISATPQPALPIPSSSGGASDKSNLVLIVDDSITLRQTIALSLQKANYRVLQARDGREALEQLQKNSQIRLVICDVEMPNMNGFEFLSQRRQDPVLSKVPVVMLTSRSSDKHKKLAMHLGAKDYFTKPYIEQEFLTAIKKLMAQSPTTA